MAPWCASMLFHRRQVCKTNQMVTRVTAWSYILVLASAFVGIAFWGSLVKLWVQLKSNVLKPMQGSSVLVEILMSKS